MPIPPVTTPNFAHQLRDQLTALVVDINTALLAIEKRLADLEGQQTKVAAKAPPTPKPTPPKETPGAGQV